MAFYTVSSGNGGGVNVRASKDQNSTRLGTISDGTQVNIVRCDATWSTLVYNSTPAFVMHQYLSGAPSLYGAGLSVGDYAICNANSVNVRDDAEGNTTGRRLNKGEQVYVREYSDMPNSVGNFYRWYRIGTDEWMRGDFLAPATGSSGGSGNTGDVTTITHFVGHINGSDVRIRNLPSTDGNIVGWPWNGQTINFSSFTGLGTNDQRRSWLWSDYPASGGFVYARYVARWTKPTEANAAHVTGTSVNLRVLPSTNAEIIGTIGTNDDIDPNDNAVLVIDTYSGWKRIVTRIGTGWMSADYLQNY